MSLEYKVTCLKNNNALFIIAFAPLVNSPLTKSSPGLTKSPRKYQVALDINMTCFLPAETFKKIITLLYFCFLYTLLFIELMYTFTLLIRPKNNRFVSCSMPALCFFEKKYRITLFYLENSAYLYFLSANVQEGLHFNKTNLQM